MRTCAGNDHELSANAVALFLALHNRDGASAAFDRAEQIGLEDLLDILLAEFVEGPREGVAGVADERIEPPVLFDRGVDNAAAILGLGDVGLETNVLAAELAIQFFQAIGPARREHKT